MTTVAVAAVVWLVLGSTTPLLPVRWLVTLVHEAAHAVAVEAVGGDVATVTINSRGGGLTVWGASSDLATWRRLLVASAGYLGTAVVGGLMLELATRLRNGRVAAGSLALVITAVGLAWVPWRFDPPGASALTSGSGSGDGRFTILYCVAAVVVLIGLAAQPLAKLRVGALLGIATALCLAAIDDLRRVLDISSRGGHSDAATAAAIAPGPSWMWAALWLVLGLAASALALWAALGRNEAD